MQARTVVTTTRRLAWVLMLLLGASCGSEQKPETAGSQARDAGADAVSTGANLAACALPRPCSWPVSSGKPEEVDSARCVVAELAAGRPLSVTTQLVSDGAVPGCETHQELHFFANEGKAYYLWRKQCGSTEERSLRRCDMLGHDAYTNCLASIDASRGASTGVVCSIPEDWVTGCAEVASATCL